MLGHSLIVFLLVAVVGVKAQSNPAYASATTESQCQAIYNQRTSSYAVSCQEQQSAAVCELRTSGLFSVITTPVGTATFLSQLLGLLGSLLTECPLSLDVILNLASNDTLLAISGILSRQGTETPQGTPQACIIDRTGILTRGALVCQDLQLNLGCLILALGIGRDTYTPEELNALSIRLNAVILPYGGDNCTVDLEDSINNIRTTTTAPTTTTETTSSTPTTTETTTSTSTPTTATTEITTSTPTTTTTETTTASPTTTTTETTTTSPTTPACHNQGMNVTEITTTTPTTTTTGTTATSSTTTTTGTTSTSVTTTTTGTTATSPTTTTETTETSPTTTTETTETSPTTTTETTATSPTTTTETTATSPTTTTGTTATSPTTTTETTATSPTTTTETTETSATTTTGTTVTSPTTIAGTTAANSVNTCPNGGFIIPTNSTRQPVPFPGCLELDLNACVGKADGDYFACFDLCVLGIYITCTNGCPVTRRCADARYGNEINNFLFPMVYNADLGQCERSYAAFCPRILDFLIFG